MSKRHYAIPVLKTLWKPACGIKWIFSPITEPLTTNKKEVTCKNCKRSSNFHLL